MRKAMFAIGTSVIAGVLVWWLTNAFGGPDPVNVIDPPPPPDPEPRVTCIGTVVAGEGLECVFDIEGPGLFAVTLTPSRAARSWSVGVSGLNFSRTCTAESPGLELFTPSTIEAVGTLTVECPVSSSTEVQGHRVVFEDRNGITNFSLEVDATFR